MFLIHGSQLLNPARCCRSNVGYRQRAPDGKPGSGSEPLRFQQAVRLGSQQGMPQSQGLCQARQTRLGFRRLLVKAHVSAGKLETYDSAELLSIRKERRDHRGQCQ